MTTQTPSTPPPSALCVRGLRSMAAIQVAVPSVEAWGGGGGGCGNDKSVVGPQSACGMRGGF